MSMILAATHDKYKVRELGASEVNPAEAAGGGGEVVDAVVGGGEVVDAGGGGDDDDDDGGGGEDFTQSLKIYVFMLES